MSNYAIVLAAGKGKRMKADMNKQFLTIKNKPILYYTLRQISNCKEIDHIVLIASKEEIEYCKTNIVKKYKFKKIENVIEGGTERQESVLKGLLYLQDKNCDIVCIHDGARPFINSYVIEKGIEYAKLYGATSCGVPPKDTIKIRKSNRFSEKTLNRDYLFCVQTPQTFNYDLILKAHLYIHKNKIVVTDDTAVVECLNHRVFLYNGDYNNIKITTPEDMILGERILEEIEKEL